jgi:hypothetical protein
MTISEFAGKVMISLAVMLTVAIGLTAQTVKYNYLAGNDFSRYKTYRWVRVDGAQYPDQLLDSQIMAAIDSQLKLKGLSRVDEGAADLVMAYQIAVTQERQWNAYSTGGDRWGWGGWRGWGGMQTTTATSSTINVGTLNLDMYDVATKKQIWRGEATKTLDPPKDPAKLQERLNKAMAKLLKNYPPGR